MGKRVVIWAILISLVAVGLVLAFRPQPALVDLAEVREREMLVTVDEEGETRVRDKYVVSAPVTGVLLRSDLKAGDAVIADKTVVARIEPHDSTLLDPRSQAEAQAALLASEAARELAKAELEQAQANLQFATSELKRARGLASNNTISEREVDEAERAHKTGLAAVATARAALQVREYELQRARAHLLSPIDAQRTRDTCECVNVLAPISGRILQLHVESEGVVKIGTPVLDLGDASELEIMVELLSNDAVKVRPGQRVIVEGWGGEHPLTGTVRRVEPYGYTKISALGIEEQRVKTLIDFSASLMELEQLGHGYRVQVRIVLWESAATLSAPLTALFRNGEQWAVFVESDGLAVQREVNVGRSNGVHAQILEGLRPGERVVVNPSDSVRDGVRIEARS
jgi:HlyD family secretion protein